MMVGLLVCSVLLNLIAAVLFTVEWYNKIEFESLKLKAQEESDFIEKYNKLISARYKVRFNKLLNGMHMASYRYLTLILEFKAPDEERYRGIDSSIKRQELLEYNIPIQNEEFD